MGTVGWTNQAGGSVGGTDMDRSEQIKAKEWYLHEIDGTEMVWPVDEI